MRVLVALMLAVALLVPGCGEEPVPAVPGTTGSFLPEHVVLKAEEGRARVGLGGTLVGGSLHYGRGQAEGREAALRDIARGRPQWIGAGVIAWHHSGVNTRNALPGVCGWDGRSKETFDFFRGYNAAISEALESGAVLPPVQVDAGSNYFALIGILALGKGWPELKAGHTAFELDTEAGLDLAPHPDDASYAYVSIVGPGPKLPFALVTRPARLYLPENGLEIVLQETSTIRVFHRETGVLLREFPHNKQDVEMVRRIHKERQEQDAAPK